MRRTCCEVSPSIVFYTIAISTIVVNLSLRSHFDCKPASHNTFLVYSYNQPIWPHASPTKRHPLSNSYQLSLSYTYFNSSHTVPPNLKLCCASLCNKHKTNRFFTRNPRRRGVDVKS